TGGVSPRSCRTIATKRVVALKGVGGDIMDVDVSAGGDVLAGESDDLPVLEDGLPLLDRHERDFIAEANSVGEPGGLAVDLDLGVRWQVAGGDGDVILRSKADGDLRQGHGRHAGSSTLELSWLLTRYRMGRSLQSRKSRWGCPGEVSATLGVDRRRWR